MNPAVLPLPQSSTVFKQSADDPFADLMPGSGTSNIGEVGASGVGDPFADLVPQNAASTGTPASPLYDAVRGLGTGIRSGVEGLIGLPGDVEKLGGHAMRWGAEQVGRLAGSSVDQEYIDGKPGGYSSAAIHDLTSKVIGEGYTPETTAGQYAKTAGEFLPSAMGGPGNLARKLLTFGLVPAVTSETAGQLTEGTEAEPYARVAGGLIGGLGGSSLMGRAVPATARQGERAAAVAATERQGVRLPEAAMPDVDTQSYIAGKLGRVPFLGMPLQRSAEATVEGVENRLQDIASVRGNPNRSNAGHDTRDTLRHWQENVSDTIMRDAYDEVDRHITAPHTLTPATHTRALVRDMLTEQAASTGTAHDPVIEMLREMTTRQGMTYAGIKAKRTEIGSRLSGKITPEPGTSQPALQRAWGALTEDLQTAVRNSGGQRALDEWRTANDTARETIERREQIARIIGPKGDASPDAILNRIVNLGGDGNSQADILLLRQMMNTLHRTTPGVREDVGASIIARMGIGKGTRGGTAGESGNLFSTAKFLTQYNKLSRDGRDVLFGADAADHLDDLALISHRHEELMKHGNPSGTGGVVSGVSLLSGLYAAPLSTISTIVTGRTVAHVLARPARAQKLVNWARARNAVLEGRGANAVQTLRTATKELSKALAEEEGGDASKIEARLNSSETHVPDSPDDSDHEYR